MPVVIVEMWEGRTIDQKRQLATDITAAFTRTGVPQDVIDIIIRDNPKHNWAVAGKLACDL